MWGRRCAECDGIDFALDWAAGDRVCTNCGLVAEGHIIDDRPEWRNFSDSGVDNSRCGEAIQEDFLATALAAGTEAACTQKRQQQSAPKPIPATEKSATLLTTAIRFREGPETDKIARTRLERAQHQANKGDTAGKAGSLRKETDFMDARMQSQFLYLPHAMRVDAMALYVRVRAAKRVNQEHQPALMAMCVITASRKSAPRTFKEVSRAFDTDKKNVCMARKEMKAAMKHDKQLKKEYGELLCGKSGDTTDAMTRIANSTVCKARHMFDRPDGQSRYKCQLLKKARSFDEVAKRRDLVGSNDPERYAMAIIMVAAQEMGVDIQEDFFASIYQVSTSTLSKHSKVLRVALTAEGLLKSKASTHT